MSTGLAYTLQQFFLKTTSLFSARTVHKWFLRVISLIPFFLVHLHTLPESLVSRLHCLVATILSTPEGRPGGRHERESEGNMANAIIPFQRAEQQQLVPHSTASGAFFCEGWEGKQHSSTAGVIKDAALHQRPLKA